VDVLASKSECESPEAAAVGCRLLGPSIPCRIPERNTGSDGKGEREGGRERGREREEGREEGREGSRKRESMLAVELGAY
jgi:hypothetical protein